MALTAVDEDLRIRALTELRGVGVPVASTLLHFAFPERSPIFGLRALESLGHPHPSERELPIGAFSWGLLANGPKVGEDQRMRIDRYTTRGRFELEASLDPAPLMVFFGRNDSGKTSLLRCFRELLRVLGGDLEEQEWHGELIVELEGLGLSDHPDEVMFRQLVQYACVWFDVARPAEVSLARALRELVLSESLDPAAYSVGRSWEPEIVVELPLEPLPSGQILSRLEEGLMQFMRDAVGDSFGGIGSAWQALVGACLSSRRFLLAEGYAEWLCPDPAGLTEELREHAAMLLRHSEGAAALEGFNFWPSFGEAPTSEFASWVEAVAEGNASSPPARYALLELQVDRLLLGAWDVVQIGDDPEAFAELEERVEAFIGDMLRSSGNVGSITDPWLEAGRGSWFRVSPLVDAVAEDVSRRATALAPAFVRDLYDIVVEPIPPADWSASDGQRVAVRLSRGGGRDDRFPLSSVGQGIGLWASYSLIETMRRIREERLRATATTEGPEQLGADLGEGDMPLAEDGRPASSGDELEPDTSEADGLTTHELLDMVWPSLDPNRRQTIYLFDEPETHLHPLAQEQVAAWIADEVRSASAIALVATHAPPFLRMATEQADYVWMRRDPDGINRPHPVTRDLLGAIEMNAAEMGFASAAEALSLARGWLVVEGTHDQEVVEHFFGDELRRARVGVLPLRGAREARSLLELEFLCRLGHPLFLLLDSVREAWITGPSTGLVPSQEEKLVTALRRQWNDPNVPLDVLSFEWPDIICALPQPCVRAMLDELYPGRSKLFPGWAELVRRYRETEQQGGFKRLVLQQLQLPNDPDVFVRDVLERCPEQTPAEASLHRSITRMLAVLSTPQPSQLQDE